MERICSLLALSGLLVACGAGEPKPDETPEISESQVDSAVTEESSPLEEESAQDSSYVEYNYMEGRTRAYLPFTSPICQEDESAEPVYEIQALWKFDTGTDAWKKLDVAPDVPYRLACNAMLDLVNVLGYDLEPATYAIVAEIGGTTERDVFYVGDRTCDVLSGDERDGQIELCIIGPDSAESSFVPDPARLEE